MFTTATNWDMFRAIFEIDKNKKIRVTWQKKRWTRVERTKDWNKIREQVVEQPNSENNENFLWRFVIEIWGQMGEIIVLVYLVVEFRSLLRKFGETWLVDERDYKFCSITWNKINYEILSNIDTRDLNWGGKKYRLIHHMCWRM